MKKVLFAAIVALAVTATLPAEAENQVTVIAQRLNNPRGLAFAPNGNLYVAEAGLGAGDGNGGFGEGVGFNGAIVEITNLNAKNKRARRIVKGLVSVGALEDGMQSVVGVDGLSIGSGNRLFAIMAESSAGVLAEAPNLPNKAQRQLGRLLRINPSGSIKTIADVGNFNYQWASENKGAPWAPQEFPDANPYGLLAAGSRTYVADAGANTVNEVLSNGTVRIIAYVPNPLLPAVEGEEPSIPVSDSVPTCVALGPDGYLYVGTLAFGANFGRFGTNALPFWATLPPQSKVYRVDPKASLAFLTEQDVWASGFNPITACAFSDGAFYATEYATQDSGYSAGDVVKVTLNADKTAGTRTTLGAGQLHEPNGLAFDKRGRVYVSNHSTSAGGGQVVRVNY